ncbi:hypothetical protein ACHMW6_30185 [Pseudoduganella sp. UC29_106]|uniref:hypothetical protein n=1 Tax=Pseudoduganella sp. UC29_106 TaxID=3374553 RepID=UPI003757F582
MNKKNLLAYGVIAVLFAAAGAWYGTNKETGARPHHRHRAGRRDRPGESHVLPDLAGR